MDTATQGPDIDSAPAERRPARARIAVALGVAATLGVATTLGVTATLHVAGTPGIAAAS